MRVFIAIEIPFEEAFNKYQNKIKDIGGFNFPKVFHLTLKFLGEVDEKKINEIKNKLKDIKFKSFKVRLGKLGVFPHEKHINVIWISLIPKDKILELQEKIEKICGKDKREFEIHITLVRVKFVKNKEKLLESLKTKIEGEFKIDTFKLIKSELTPKGAVYTVLEEYGKKM